MATQSVKAGVQSTTSSSTTLSSDVVSSHEGSIVVSAQPNIVNILSRDRFFVSFAIHGLLTDSTSNK